MGQRSMYAFVFSEHNKSVISNITIFTKCVRVISDTVDHKHHLNMHSSLISICVKERERDVCQQYV